MQIQNLHFHGQLREINRSCQLIAADVQIPHAGWKLRQTYFSNKRIGMCIEGKEIHRKMFKVQRPVQCIMIDSHSLHGFWEMTEIKRSDETIEIHIKLEKRFW
mmetsp:Transcript_34561/g.53954  ORF Transcript_34561/g.53954 Transcript_34561/m.53954 type:complete len:103 (-) Transcript_34561:361-669(-)